MDTFHVTVADPATGTEVNFDLESGDKRPFEVGGLKLVFVAKPAPYHHSCCIDPEFRALIEDLKRKDAGLRAELQKLELEDMLEQRRLDRKGARAFVDGSFAILDAGSQKALFDGALFLPGASGFKMPTRVMQLTK